MRRRRLRPQRMPARGKTAGVEFVSANPTGPLHVGHGRDAGDRRLPRAPARRDRLARSRASSTTTTPACRSHNLALSVQARCRGIESGRRRLARRRLSRRLHPDVARAYLARRSVHADGDDGRRRRRCRRSRRDPPLRRRLACAASRISICKAFGVALRRVFPGILAVHRRQGRRDRARARRRTATPTRKAARCGCARPTSATTRTA